MPRKNFETADLWSCYICGHTHRRIRGIRHEFRSHLTRLSAVIILRFTELLIVNTGCSKRINAFMNSSGWSHDRNEFCSKWQHSDKISTSCIIQWKHILGWTGQIRCHRCDVKHWAFTPQTALLPVTMVAHMAMVLVAIVIFYGKGNMQYVTYNHGWSTNFDQERNNVGSSGDM